MMTKTNHIRAWVALAAMAVALCCLAMTVTLPSYAQTQTADVTYKVKDLGGLPGGFIADPFAVNNSGVVVGKSDSYVFGGTATYAFIADPNVRFLFGSEGGAADEAARDINDAGQVVGTFKGRAFLYENGVRTYLSSFGGDAEGINQSGQIVGWFQTETSPNEYEYHPFLYENGSMKDLGTLGGNQGQAVAINDSRQITGWSRSTTDQRTRHGFFYENGTMHDIGNLGGSFVQPHDINNSGQVVGIANTGENNYAHAFLYENGSMKDLGAPPGDNSSQAVAINDAGQVVGDRYLYEDGTWKNLNSLVSDLPFGIERISWANDINNKGQIVAAAQYLNGNLYGYHIVLLTPECAQPPAMGTIAAQSASGDCQAPEVKIGTQDNVEPAIDTSRFASTLEVRSVEGLGCSIEGTNGPACSFEWLRTSTQQKSDVNFKPSIDSVAPDHQYNLADNGQNDEWLKFKVRVTNPETKATAESNVIEVDTMVGRVEAIMRHNNWLNGAQFQKRWKESAPGSAPDYALTDIDTIKMDTFVLKVEFERAITAYNEILANLRSNKKGQQDAITKLLTMKGFLDGQEHDFGDLENDTRHKLDEDHVQSIIVDRKGRGDFPNGGQADDMLAALATFELKAAVSGTVKPEPGGQKLQVQIKEAGIFVEDSFDFEDSNTFWSQPLGCWDPVNNTVSENFALTCKGTALDNADYREWRDHHGKGGDFKVYSDVKREPLNLEFTIKAPRPTK
jgi:probable HAF family extracellular repeat protein